jgi:hypothetical protein
MKHPPRPFGHFAKRLAKLRSLYDQLSSLIFTPTSEDISGESRIAWREYCHVHFEIALIEDAMVVKQAETSVENTMIKIDMKCRAEESRQALKHGPSIPDLLSLSFSKNPILRQAAMLMLAFWIYCLSYQGQEEGALAIVQHVNSQVGSQDATHLAFLNPFIEEIQESPPAKVLRVENGRVLASLQHPNPRYGRFRYLFEKDEIPEHIFQDLQRGCSLIVKFDQDAEGGIKAIWVKGFHPGPLEQEEKPKLVGGAFEDMDSRRENERRLNPRYAAVMDEARRIREQQTPS